MKRRRTFLPSLVLLAALFHPSGAPAVQPATGVFQYAVFYDGLLEFNTAPGWTINGPVHANGSIHTGSGQPLVFNDTVTTVGTISAPPMNGQSTNAYTGGVTYNGNPTFVTNIPSRVVLATTTLIDMPTTPDWNNPIGQQRLYNQAQVVLLIGDSTVTTVIQAGGPGYLPGGDPSPIRLVSVNSALATNFPFLTLSNTFTDWRENKTAIVSQIDIGKYAAWLINNTFVSSKFPPGPGNYPLILYVADNRTTDGTEFTAVRLTNGIAPPANGGLGFSVATPNPLYVWGSYNCPNAAYLGTTNTSASGQCAFMADALTILSSAWKDTNQIAFRSSGGVRVATNDTVNAAVIAGNVPSTGAETNQFSGGVHNLPRLLEDWGNSYLALNGSLVNLFASRRVTSQFQNSGIYYRPPLQRRFNFDTRFADPASLPPGTPLFPAVTFLEFVLEPGGCKVPVGGTAFFTALATNGPGTTDPVFYQWRFNTTNISGATNNSLWLTNVQPSQAGNYAVGISNLHSFYFLKLSHNALLTVTSVPPAIVIQPTNQIALAGSSTTFTVIASGTEPLSYQWQLNNTSVDDETNATLTLTGLIPDQAGEYSVTVTNAGGVLTSSNATLSIYVSAAASLNDLSAAPGNQIQFSIVGVPGFSYAVEASTNLIDWLPLTTNASPFTFVDTNTVDLPQLFYRTSFVP